MIFLSQSPESTEISSSTENEDTECDMWVKDDLYSTTHDDCGSHWVADHLTAQMLILQYFNNTSGLQPPPLQKVFAFEVHSRQFAQVGNYVVSTVGCGNGVVNVYDSLYSSVSDSITYVLHCNHGF